MTTQQQFHPGAFALQLTIDLSNEVERELTRLLGLHLTDFRALSALSRLSPQGPVTVGRLADQLGASPATTTAIVNRLEQGGYVERERTERDRRLVHVRVTTAGSRRVMAAMAPLMVAVSDHLWALPREDQRAVLDFLGVVHDHLQAHIETMSAQEA